MGNPIRLKRGIFAKRNQFHHLKLSSHVQHAYQALAIDEERRHFNATLWQRQSHAPAEQVLEQVWFAGVHADVDGGFSKRHLSDITLEWMVEKARKLDLGVGPIEPVPDPDEAQEPHNSRTGIYKLAPVKIREIANPPKDAVTRTNRFIRAFLKSGGKTRTAPQAFRNTSGAIPTSCRRILPKAAPHLQTAAPPPRMTTLSPSWLARRAPSHGRARSSRS